MRQMASHGAALEWEPAPRKGLRVRIDGSAWIRMAHSVGALLRVLAEDTDPPAGDGLVGWKTEEEIRARLEKVRGWPTTEPALKQLVYRLKDELQASHVNAYLLQSDPRLGRRFARRRERKEPERAASQS